MKTQTENQIDDQNGNKSKPLLYAVAFGSSSSTNARCLNGHTWTYAGSIHYNLENHPCDCGEVLYHSEPCKCCGNNVVNPIPRNNI
jgi:hypothetical protein